MAEEAGPKFVLLRLTPSMAAAVDQAAHELGQTRSGLVREAIANRLAFYQHHEREILLHLRQQANEAHANR